MLRPQSTREPPAQGGLVHGVLACRGQTDPTLFAVTVGPGNGKRGASYWPQAHHRMRMERLAHWPNQLGRQLSLAAKRGCAQPGHPVFLRSPSTGECDLDNHVTEERTIPPSLVSGGTMGSAAWSVSAHVRIRDGGPPGAWRKVSGKQCVVLTTASGVIPSRGAVPTSPASPLPLRVHD